MHNESCSVTCNEEDKECNPPNSTDHLDKESHEKVKGKQSDGLSNKDDLHSVIVPRRQSSQGDSCQVKQESSPGEGSDLRPGQGQGSDVVLESEPLQDTQGQNLDEQKDLMNLDEHGDLMNLDEQENLMIMDEQEDLMNLDKQKSLMNLDEPKNLMNLDKQKNLMNLDEQKNLMNLDEQTESQHLHEHYLSQGNNQEHQLNQEHNQEPDMRQEHNQEHHTSQEHNHEHEKSQEHNQEHDMTQENSQETQELSDESDQHEIMLSERELTKPFTAEQLQSHDLVDCRAEDLIPHVCLPLVNEPDSSDTLESEKDETEENNDNEKQIDSITADQPSSNQSDVHPSTSNQPSIDPLTFVSGNKDGAGQSEAKGQPKPLFKSQASISFHLSESE